MDKKEQTVKISLQEYKTLLLAYAELMTIKKYEQMYYEEQEEAKSEIPTKQKIGFKTN